MIVMNFFYCFLSYQIIGQVMEEYILNCLQTVMFRGTPCISKDINRDQSIYRGLKNFIKAKQLIAPFLSAQWPWNE